MSPFLGGDARNLDINFLILPFNSDAAFFVNVIATVSVGSNPCQFFISVRSLAGQRSAPKPFKGILAAGGKSLVAL